jgi:hypothetical protein
MPDTGWVSPSAHDNAYLHTSVNNWGAISNAERAYDGDIGTGAVISGDNTKNFSGVSYGLHLYGFGFDTLIPAGATFEGIELRLRSRVPIDQDYDQFIWFNIPGVVEEDSTTSYTVSELTNSTVSSEYYRNANETVTTGLPDNYLENIIGSPTSTWSPDVTLAKIQENLFGPVIVFDCQSYVDRQLSEIAMRVYYAGGDPMSVRDGGTWKTASPHVKDGGIWKPATPHVKDGGVWKSS